MIDIRDVFVLNYYNNVLTQKQIDVYNALVGGRTLDDGTKIKGLNEYINLYNQKQKDKLSRLPKFKSLYKQILSDRNAISWLPEQFHSDEEVLEAILKAYQDLDEQVLNRNREGEHSLKELLVSLSYYDLSKIYVRNDTQMTDISQKAFGHWGVISKALLEQLKKDVQKKSKKESDEAYEERLNKIIRLQGSIPITIITEGVQKHNSDEQNTLQSYFASLGAVEIESGKKENLFTLIENAYAEVKDLLNTPYLGKNLAQDEESVKKNKDFIGCYQDASTFCETFAWRWNRV